MCLPCTTLEALPLFINSPNNNHFTQECLIFWAAFSGWEVYMSCLDIKIQKPASIYFDLCLGIWIQRFDEGIIFCVFVPIFIAEIKIYYKTYL